MSDASRQEKRAETQGTEPPTRHPVIFCGAGPGDPELITVKGQRALAEADLIVYAGSLVPEAVLRWKKPTCAAVNSAALHLGEIVATLVDAYRRGQRVVRLHTGDPSLYGAIYEQIAELDKREVPYRIIPGVTAAFAAAASLGIEYTLPEISQTLILTRMAGRTPVPETESLAALAAHQASMAIYLSTGLADEVARVLSDAYGPDSPCAVVYRASQPEEKVIWTTAAELPRTLTTVGITRQALIIAGRVLGVGTDGLQSQSRLYARNFSHGFRKGDVG
jgi:precorrin-4/cobalt-precorrin-4 C11-methyltransferase